MNKSQIFNQKTEVIALAALALLFFIGFIFSYKEYNKQDDLAFVSAPVENGVFKKYFYITGEVVNPGVYEFTNDLRVIDAINKAGGFTAEANSKFVNESINLSALVKDEEKIFIPSTQTAVMGQSHSGNNTALININTASIDQLISLPGIGKVTAQKIVDNRPYQQKQDILRVSGIGTKKYEAIENQISVE